MEACALFWAGGAATAGRDLARGRWVAAPRAAAAGATSRCSASRIVGFPWTPLFLPLLDSALAAPSLCPPRSARLASRRSRGCARASGARTPPAPRRTAIADAPRARRRRTSRRAPASSPMAAARRASRRGRVFATATPACYAWFALLTSTFPLTPLLPPVIDVRRPGGRRCDCVRLASARRLAAFAASSPIVRINPPKEAPHAVGACLTAAAGARGARLPRARARNAARAHAARALAALAGRRASSVGEGVRDREMARRARRKRRAPRRAKRRRRRPAVRARARVVANPPARGRAPRGRRSGRGRRGRAAAASTHSSLRDFSCEALRNLRGAGTSHSTSDNGDRFL